MFPESHAAHGTRIQYRLLHNAAIFYIMASLAIHQQGPILHAEAITSNSDSMSNSYPSTAHPTGIHLPINCFQKIHKHHKTVHLELGIILLELWHNKRVEAYASEGKLAYR